MARTFQRGDKTKFAREAIEALGVECKLTEANDWLQRKYGKEVMIGDNTFYPLRELFALEQQEEGERQKFEREQAAALDVEAKRNLREQQRQQEAARESQAAAAAEAEKLRQEIADLMPSQAATRMLD